MTKESTYNPYNLEWNTEIAFPSTRSQKEYGNRIYNRYPARSVFLVPRAILAAQSKKGLSVLDPFMGSGTTAVETLISGNIPYGVEMDPFARLVATVSASPFSQAELSELKQSIKYVICEWQKYSPAEEPDLLGINRWFGETEYIELRKLKNCILSLKEEKIRDFLLIAFADCIKPSSKMERQSLKPYISTKYEKEIKPVSESFSASVESHLMALEEMSSACGYKTHSITWLGNDATVFEAKKESIDIAITSPPYINALDYTRCIKVESAMCDTMTDDSARLLRHQQVGHSDRRKQEIAPEVKATFAPYYEKIVKADVERADTCQAYFNDIYKNLKCVYSALRTGGEYHMIIGDNTIKGVEVPTHEIIARLAVSLGFEWFGYYHYQIKDHRTSIPRNNAKNKIQVEYVLMLRK